MNDGRSFEQFVADNVAGEGAISMPEDFYDGMHTFATDSRQRPEWLALIKEPPMRSNSRVAVGSPTMRVVAIMVTTLLLAMLVAGAGIAGQRLLAADDTIVVAQDGSGHYTTITEAVAAAVDGDEILVMSGTYPESVVIDKDITLLGEDRDSVIIEITEDAPTDAVIFNYTIRYAFLLDGVDATVGNLTITASTTNLSALVVIGGSPTIRDVVASLGPSGSFGPLRGFVFMDAATGTIRDNVTDAFLWVDGGSTPEIYDNISTHAIRTNGAGTEPWIHGNVAKGIWAHDSSPLVEDNDISGSTGGDCGIEAAGAEARPTVRNNRVRQNNVGICLYEDGGPVELTGNTVTENGVGLRVNVNSEVPELTGNIICDNDVNLVVPLDVDTPSDEVLCSESAG